MTKLTFVLCKFSESTINLKKEAQTNKKFSVESETLDEEQARR